MSRIGSAAWALACALAAALAPAHAGAALFLHDGRTVSGADVRREGANYLLTQDDGQIVTIPIELVRELRLEDEGPPAPRPAPTAMRSAGPEVLAGPPEPVEPPVVEDQAAVLGPPARFQRGVFDPVWIPTSDWTLDPAQNDFNPARWFTAPIVTDWAPLSAFDGRVDVLAGGRSTWKASLIDATWWPTGTTWLTPRKAEPAAPAAPEVEHVPPGESVAEPVEVAQFTPAGREPVREGRVDPQVCAREIFRPLTGLGDRAPESKLRVEPVVDPALTPLEVDLFRGRLELDGRSWAALFTTGGGECRLIGGDLDDLLGVALGEPGRIDHSLRSYESALGGRPAPRLATAADKITYAHSLTLLADPATSHGPGAAPALLPTRADLERVGGAPAGACSFSTKKRTREIERALAEFSPPAVVATDVGDVVTLRTWSADGGVVVLHTVRLSPTGPPSIERRVVARHIGAHEDVKPRD
jgi:hypothetical protein